MSQGQDIYNYEQDLTELVNFLKIYKDTIESIMTASEIEECWELESICRAVVAHNDRLLQVLEPALPDDGDAEDVEGEIGKLINLFKGDDEHVRPT